MRMAVGYGRGGCDRGSAGQRPSGRPKLTVRLAAWWYMVRPVVASPAGPCTTVPYMRPPYQRRAPQGWAHMAYVPGYSPTGPSHSPHGTEPFPHGTEPNHHLWQNPPFVAKPHHLWQNPPFVAKTTVKPPICGKTTVKPPFVAKLREIHPFVAKLREIHPFVVQRSGKSTHLWCKGRENRPISDCLYVGKPTYFWCRKVGNTRRISWILPEKRPETRRFSWILPEKCPETGPLLQTLVSHH